jgi:hypothetical protein
MVALAGLRSNVLQSASWNEVSSSSLLQEIMRVHPESEELANTQELFQVNTAPHTMTVSPSFDPSLPPSPDPLSVLPLPSICKKRHIHCLRFVAIYLSNVILDRSTCQREGDHSHLERKIPHQKQNQKQKDFVRPQPKRFNATSTYQMSCASGRCASGSMTPAHFEQG